MERSNVERSSKMPEKSSPTRLGRGLSALIPPQSQMPVRPAPADSPAASAAEGVQELPIASIAANPGQPRTVFDADAHDDLTASVRRHGVLQPVMVRPRGGGQYQLVAGERRFRAAQEAGLTQIPAVVRSLTDAEALTVALIENIQREDLNPIEAARGYKQLMEEYGLTQTQLGEQIGKKQSTISNAMRLLHLPMEMQDSIAEGRLSVEHGKVLLSVENSAERLVLWQDFLAMGLSRNEARDYAKAANTLTSRPAPRPARDPDWHALEDRLKRAFEMKIALKPTAKGGGTLTVRFGKPEELEHLLEKLQAK